MIQADRRLVIRVLQIPVKLVQRRGDKQPFVHDHSRGEGWNVKVLDLLLARTPFDLIPAKVELPLVFCGIHGRRARHEQLLNDWQGGQCLIPEEFLAHWNGTPPNKPDAAL
jgi:hypothetical protein